MGFIRKRDYFTRIREQDLDVILKQLDQITTHTPDQIRIEKELQAQKVVEAKIGHRYDIRKIFVDILTYSSSVQYNENDLIEYSETAYDATATYSLDDLVSYSETIGDVTTDKIFKCTTAIGTPEPFDPTKWSFITDNFSLYTNRIPTSATKPETDFTYDANVYSGNHDSILGWNRANTMYLKREGTKIVLYDSTADRSAGANSVGIVEFDPKAKQFPNYIPITRGVDIENSVTGDLSIIGFVPDLTTWQIDPSNNWEKADTRHKLVIGLVLDLAIFDLHGLISARNIPDFVGQRRDDAMEMLKDIQKGNISPDLPIFNNIERGQGITFGSRRKNSYTPFESSHNNIGHTDKDGDRIRRT